VSTDNPVIMLIFLIYSMILCWGYVSNSNVTMKFAQIHYSLSQNVGGSKDIMSPPVQKLWGRCPPFPHKLGPWARHVPWRHFDGGANIAWWKLKILFTVSWSWTSILRPPAINCNTASTQCWGCQMRFVKSPAILICQQCQI